MFKEIQIYCSGDEVCFDDIQKSERPTIVVNTENIVSISERRTWGFCRGNENFPYRVIQMSTGERILCVLESANELVRILEESGENNADVFIKKACAWLREQEEMVGVSFQEDFIERFKDYMKRE